MVLFGGILAGTQVTKYAIETPRDDWRADDAASAAAGGFLEGATYAIPGGVLVKGPGLLAKALTKVPGAARFLGPLGGSALSRASREALRASRNINKWTPKSYHLPGSSGARAKFAIGIDPRAEVAAALRRNDGLFLPNDEIRGSFRYIGDAGRAVGTKGQTRIRIIVKDGRVRNAFPVYVR